MSTLDEVSTSIGGLEAQMVMVMHHLERRETAGEALREEVRQLQADVKEVKADVARILPAAKKVEKYEQWVIAVSAAVGAIVTLIGAGIVERVRSWLQ